MSQLRAPAARADRREGGRHGRPATRLVLMTPETHIRSQLVRTAVLPALATGLSGAAAVLITLRAGSVRPTTELWALLLGCAVLAVAALAAAALGANRTAKAVLDRCNALRRSSARGQAELRGVVEQLRRGEGPPAPSAPKSPPPAGDELDLLGHELGRAQELAVAAVVQASQLSSSADNDQRVEVFVNLARRLQSLVHREIQLLDELENEVEDPDLLKGLFHVDHLATRIRRHAENLAVLGGAVSRRQWSHPVTMTEVLRSSIAEVEQYSRVKLVPPIDGTLRGHAVADVIHLLAELVENATAFSAPHTTVLLRAQHVTAGLAVEVEDRGLGMAVGEQHKMNALLCDPDQVDVAHLLEDGRIGLFVVSALARRHGIAVRLQTNIYGGIQAVLVLPQGLLGAEPETGTSQAVEGRTAGPRMHASTGPMSTGPMSTGPVFTGPVFTAPPAARPVPATPQRLRQPQAAPPGVATPRTESGAGILPVRGIRYDRPNPAGARPGPVPAATPEHSAADAAPLAPHVQPPGVVRGTMGRPQLPKRRSQEHLVPQLRDAPARRKETEQPVHDPGLMAAFQRGIGLAEAQPARGPVREPAREPARPPREPGGVSREPGREPHGDEHVGH
ncbi:ATP-binding protein [Streptomyces sp. NPDC051219]|uniref:ATP-binding protein n=1 Tax=Streptomyces sp. NPDC051219 TaxID=3155283 RepID=UPI003431F035